MPVSRFVEGMRVILDNAISTSMRTIRPTGVLKKSRNRYYLLIDEEYDYRHLGHDCEGLTPIGRGWWVELYEVSSLGSPEPYKCSRPKSGFSKFVLKQEKKDVRFYERLRARLAKREARDAERLRKKEEKECLKIEKSLSKSKKRQKPQEDSSAISM